MKTQVTKRKTLKLKRTDAVGPAAGGEPPPPAPDGLVAPPQAAPAKGASYTFAGICAIISLICFIALVLLQWTEFTFLKTAFPLLP